jgi:putative MATE family efflux protein
MLRVMNTPEDIIGDAYNYIIIIFVGICASFFYNLLSGILRALGDSKTPLYFLIIASALNIALDFLFILAFKMGVAGAAVATVVAQAVSGFLCLIYMGKKFPILKLNRADWHFDPAFAWTHLKIGLPMALQFSVTAIGVMILQSALNQFGSTTVAAYTAASKVEIIFTQPMVTLGVTTATFTAQNLGARRYDRIKQGVKISCLLAVGATVLAICAALFLGHFFVGLFIDSPTEEMYDVAQQYLNIISIFFIFLSQLYVFRNALQGIGDAFVPFMAGVMELIMRSLACATLPQRLGYTGVCLASPLAWIGAAVPLAITYIIRSKKLFSDTARLTDV